MAIRLIVQGPSSESPGRAYPLLFDQPRIHLGRSASADLCLPHPSVSPLHASIRLEGSTYVLVDEGSTNGTRVDTHLLPPQRKKKLIDGALVHIGVFAVRVELLSALPEPADPRRCAQVARALLVDLMEAEGAPLETPALILPARKESIRLIDSPLPLTLWLDTSGELRVSHDSSGVIMEPLGRLYEEGSVYSLEALNEGLMIDEQIFRRRKLKNGAIISHGRARMLFQDPIGDALEARYVLADEEGDFDLPASDGVQSPAVPVSDAESEIAHADQAAAPGAAEMMEATPGVYLEDASPPHAAPSESSRWAPRASNAPHSHRGADGPDAIVYMLAGAMIALSALGLYLLLGRL